MPRKIIELIRELEQAGFINKGGKGSHRKFVHSYLKKPVVISGQLGDDALPYQEKSVKTALKELKR